MSTEWEKLQSRTIDCLRPILAFMVVGLHAQLFYVGAHWSIDGGLFDIIIICLCKVVFPVAVPAFFFISGFLFFHGLEQWNWNRWKEKIRKRVHTLLIPYMLWNIIALVAFPLTRLGGVILNGGQMPKLLTEIDGECWLRLFWDRTLYSGNIHYSVNILGWNIPCGQPMNTPLWFIRDLMVAILLSPVIYFLIKKIGQIFLVILAILFVVNIWIPISGIGIKALFFFSWGAFFSIKGRSFLESFYRIKTPLAIMYVVLLIVIPFLWNKEQQIFGMVLRIFNIISVAFIFNLMSLLISKKHLNVSKQLVNSSFFIYSIHLVLVSSVVMWAVMQVHTYIHTYIHAPNCCSQSYFLPQLS